MILDFAEDGVAESMHHDGLPLTFLGDMEVSRASEIRFNSLTQKWDIELIEGGKSLGVVPASCGFYGYDIARKVEAQWLSQCRLHGAHPFSESGVLILTGIRNKPV